MAHRHGKSEEDQMLATDMDPTGRYSSWGKFIQTCRAKDFYTPVKNVVKVNTTDSIKTVLSALFAYKLKGFPVYDIDADKYRAFVDVFDIVAYLLDVIEKARSKKGINLPTDGRQIILSHEIAELDIPIGAAMNYGQENFLFMLPESTLLREVMYVMGPGHKHRVWLYNAAKDVGTGLITHEKMMQLLKEDLPHFPDISNRTIESLGLIKDKLLSIGYEKTVSDAFRILTANNMQSLAILSQDGRLENEISVNDVKALSLFDEFFENLELSIGDYFSKLKKYATKKSIVTCKKTDTVHQVITKLTHHRTSHLFVVEEEEEEAKERELEEMNILIHSKEERAPKAVCVISAGDVLRSLWQFCDE